MAYSREKYTCPSKRIYRSSFGRSEIIGYFSVDEHRNYVPDCSSLLYYNPPAEGTVLLDLNQGVESTVHHPDSVARERLEFLLEWITLNRSKIETPVRTHKWIQPDFVCPAGLLSRMLSSPFSPEDSWAILAAKWKGTIYLYVDKTNKTRYSQADDAMKLIHWGYKFQQLVLSESPYKVPNTCTPLIQSKEFRCVYQRHLGDYKILFDNVMKGVRSEEQLIDPLPLKDLEFIETRTSRVVEHPGHEKTLRKHKFLTWWSRAFLSNTENLLCGFRDENGIVRKLQTYSLDEMVASAEFYWNPAICVTFGKELLKQIAEGVVNDCDETIYKIDRKPEQSFRVSREIISCTELSASDENALLPTWYLDETQSCR